MLMAVILLTTEAAKRRGIKRLMKVDVATAVKLWWAKHDGTTDPVLKAKLADIEQVYLGTENVPGQYKVERYGEPPEQEELWYQK